MASASADTVRRTPDTHTKPRSAAWTRTSSGGASSFVISAGRHPRARKWRAHQPRESRGVSAAHNLRTGEADSLKLTRAGLDRLQGELDAARERLGEV